MTGIGIVILYIGYATVAWGVNSIQGNKQPSFASQLFPFGGAVK